MSRATVVAAPPSKPHRNPAPRSDDSDGDSSGLPVGSWKTWAMVGGLISTILVFGVIAVVVLRGKKTPEPETAHHENMPDGPKPELSFPDLVAKCEPSVARVLNRTGTGSGFLIKPGIVVTNFHVISGDLVDKIEVTFPSVPGGSEKKYAAKLLHADRKRDLAVLKIDTSATPLALSNQDVRKGDTVYVIGSPGVGGGDVSSNSATKGSMSNNNFHLDEMKYYQTDAAINPGNSGGPIFNSRGEVIGVAVAKLKNKEGMNLAIPWQDVQSALEKAERAAPADHDHTSAEHNLTEVTERLLITSAAYYHALDKLEDRLLAGLNQKREFLPLIRGLKSEYAEVLNLDYRIHFNPVSDIFASTVSSRDLSESSRGDKEVQALRDLYIEMKGTFDALPDGVNMLSNRRKDYESRFNAVTDRLKLKLGIDPKDRYAQSRTLVKIFTK